jgi:bifunctional pyridoxal-dependent enzyme with beta-cystathionase and maltose regulon repressor activities
VYIDTDGVNNFDLDCVDLYEEALVKAREEGIIVRILLLCNPHNPLGMLFLCICELISQYI